MRFLLWKHHQNPKKTRNWHASGKRSITIKVCASQSLCECASHGTSTRCDGNSNVYMVYTMTYGRQPMNKWIKQTKIWLSNSNPIVYEWVQLTACWLELSLRWVGTLYLPEQCTFVTDFQACSPGSYKHILLSPTSLYPVFIPFWIIPARIHLPLKVTSPYPLFLDHWCSTCLQY